MYDEEDLSWQHWFFDGTLGGMAIAGTDGDGGVSLSDLNSEALGEEIHLPPQRGRRAFSVTGIAGIGVSMT